MQGQSVRVYLKQEEWTYKCADYRSVIGIKMRVEYAALNQILINRDRGDDVAYWMSLYQEKLATFMLAYAQLERLEKTVAEFEESMLHRSQEYIATSVQQTADTYNRERKVLFANLLNSYSAEQQKRLTKIDTLLAHIKTIQETQVMDEFLPALEQYLVLTEQLKKWK